jgi:AraC family transcriptional regulator, regulatory protein of adaptative response / DNA-3-methyladenine glycosylase II
MNSTAPTATTLNGMTPEQMYQAFCASDVNANGRFFTGVLTTGIYCLPSCRARKPRPENVRFYESAGLALADGFRACRKCHPDDFARGIDPLIEQIESLAAEVRNDPAAFPDVRSLVTRSGYGPTRLFELFRLRFDMTPAEFLLRTRIETAKHLLETTALTVTDVAYASGFRSLSVFHDNFKRRTGLTPACYRRETQL